VSSQVTKFATHSSRMEYLAANGVMLIAPILVVLWVAASAVEKRFEDSQRARRVICELMGGLVHVITYSMALYLFLVVVVNGEIPSPSQAAILPIINLGISIVYLFEVVYAELPRFMVFHHAFSIVSACFYTIALKPGTSVPYGFIPPELILKNSQPESFFYLLVCGILLASFLFPCHIVNAIYIIYKEEHPKIVYALLVFTIVWDLVVCKLFAQVVFVAIFIREFENLGIPAKLSVIAFITLIFPVEYYATYNRIQKCRAHKRKRLDAKKLYSVKAGSNVASAASFSGLITKV